MKIFPKMGLLLTKSLHFIILIAAIASIPHIVTTIKLWIALPLSLALLSLVLNGGIIPLTDLENSFRKKLGRPRIKCFVGHYVSDLICPKR